MTNNISGGDMMVDYELFSSKGEREKNEDSVRIVDKGNLKAFISFYLFILFILFFIFLVFLFF